MGEKAEGRERGQGSHSRHSIRTWGHSQDNLDGSQAAKAPLIQGWSPGNHMFGIPQASRRFASRKAGGVIRWRILDKMENLCHLLLPRQKQIFQLSSWRNPSLCAPGSLDIRNEASETSHQNILGEVAPTSQTLTTN